MMNNKLTTPGEVARGGNYVLNRVIAVFLALVLFFSVYALYDVWRIYQGANADSFAAYKPEEGELGLEELIKINPDVCGWITINDTHMDYPVVQGKDNLEYLDIDPQRKPTPGGSIFLDCTNRSNFKDLYSILYGHHMAGDLMFSDVLKFHDKKYFDSHKYGVLQVAGGGKYTVEIFAYIDTDGYDNKIYTTIRNSKSEKMQLLSYIKRTASQYRSLEGLNGSRLICLSTCTDTMGDDRGIIVGKISKYDPSKVNEPDKSGESATGEDFWDKLIKLGPGLSLLFLIVLIVSYCIRRKREQ